MVCRAFCTFYPDGTDSPQEGMLVLDEDTGILHFYAGVSANSRFFFSLGPENGLRLEKLQGTFKLRWHAGGGVPAGSLIFGDEDFAQRIGQCLSQVAAIEQQQPTSLFHTAGIKAFKRVALILAAAFFLAVALFWYANLFFYRLIPPSWDRKIAELAELELAAWGERCSSPQTEKKLKKILAFLVPPTTVYQYELHILRSEVENAVALPGGMIVLFSEIIAQAKSYSELAGILAHEIGHTENRHGVRQLTFRFLLQIFLSYAFGFADDFPGAAADTGLLLLLMKNSRDHEREADQYAAAKLADLGISSLPLRQFFQRMQKKYGQMTEQVPVVMLSHPPEAERIEFLAQYEMRHSKKLRRAQSALRAELRQLLSEKPLLAASCQAKRG